MPITDEERKDIVSALTYWANYIETGDLTLSAQDASNMGSNFNALDIDQMKKVIKLRELAEAFRTKKK